MNYRNATKQTILIVLLISFFQSQQNYNGWFICQNVVSLVRTWRRSVLQVYIPTWYEKYSEFWDNSTKPDKFKVEIANRQITVNNMSSQVCEICYLYVEKHQKILYHQKKFHLHNLNGCCKSRTSFAHGYACLEFTWYD